MSELQRDTAALRVTRLTSEPTAFFSRDVGTLVIGARADITIINPEHLATTTKFNRLKK